MEANESSRLNYGSNKGKGWVVTTDLERRLLAFILVLLAIGILAIVVVVHTRGKSEQFLNQSSKVCTSPQCIITASNLLQSMDLKQEPCDDFYSFVCGNWIKNTYLVKPISTQFTRLNNIITLRIKELLESNTGTTEHENKTRAFYHACMDVETRSESKSKVLMNDLTKFGGWPLLETDWDASNFNWSGLMVQFFENGYPIDMLLGIGVVMDIKNTSTSLIEINQPTLGLSDRGYYALSKDKVLRRYKEVILELALHLNPELDKETVAREIEEAFKVEKQLAEATVAKSIAKNPEDYYNIMTLKDIEVFAPKIPWRDLLTDLLPPGTDLQDDQKLMVTVPPALTALNKILTDYDNEIGRRVLANYMIYRAVLFAVEHLEEELFFLYEDKLYRSAHRDLWQVCLSTVVNFFHMSVTATYAKLYADNETRSLLETMLQDVQVSLLDDIQRAKWLDEETRERALLKVRKIKSAVAYRDEIFDERKLNDYYSSIDVGEDHLTNVKTAYEAKLKKRMEGLNTPRVRFRWSEMHSVLIANAFYLPNQNSIIIPVGVLQDPFFLLGRPNYMNYGSLGAIAGHEYTHAFDSKGGLHDEDGNYRKWWTDISWKNYKEKTECYVEQYDKYYESHVHSFLNGSNTLSENTADNGGLRAAYDAYQRVLGRMKYEKQLPGLAYSERQMFWIAFASVWCRKQSYPSLENIIENGVHSPSKFRVNGALANMREFADDFKCKEGSALNPKTKCSLWE